MEAKLQAWLNSHPVIFQGETVTIRNVFLNGESQAGKFFDELKEGDKTKTTAIMNLIDNKKGKVENGQKFKKLLEHDHESILEVKATKQVRIACIWEKDYNLMLLFGTTKQSDQWKSGDIQQLKNVYDEYAAKKQSFLSKP